MKKPVIVLAIPTLQGNGAERVVLTLAEGFTQYGCDVHIVLTLKNFIEHESSRQFNTHYFKQYYRWIPKSIRGRILAPLLDKFIVNTCGKPDLVLSSLLPSDIMLCHSKFNTHLIIQNTTSKEDGGYNEAKAIYAKKPVICCSQGVKKDFDQFVNGHILSTCIYNSVDIDFIKQQADKFQPKYSDYIVHVAKFKNQKRHDILIKAYQQSGVKNPLVLVGNGALKDECMELVNELGLNKRVFFVGFQSNHYPFVKHASVMILSSDFEGLPTVVMESLALETPVISTDCPSGPSEILPKNNLVPVGDIEALADKMADAVKEPGKYQANLKDDFLLKTQIEKYLQLIK